MLLADEIAIDLNETAFSKPFKACRKWLPVFDKEDLATIQVTVVPKGEVSRKSDRTRWQSDYRIDIGIQRHVVSDNQPEIDDLAELAEEIFDRYASNVIAIGTAQLGLIGREWIEVISAKDLNEARVFMSLQTLTFTGWRDT